MDARIRPPTFFFMCFEVCFVESEAGVGFGRLRVRAWGMHAFPGGAFFEGSFSFLGHAFWGT